MSAVATFVAPGNPSRVASNITAAAPARTNYAWLDVLKGIAILAVVVDHAFLVDDYLLWKQTYFHVSWFILLAGVSNTLSAGRGEFSLLHGAPAMLFRRLRTLLGPYLWVSTLAFLVLHFRHPSPVEFARELVLFRALPPLYFIALLLQLLLLFPLLYLLIQRAGWAGRIAAVPLVVVLSAVISQRVTFPWALGAHYLFGASFLDLFAIGVLVAPWLARMRPNPLLLIAAALPPIALAQWLVVQSNGDLMTHPPSNVLLVYAVALLLPCFALAVRFASAAPVRLIEAIGHRSLAIFLYHYLFLMPFLYYRDHPWTGSMGLVPGQIVLMAVAVPLAVVGSIVLSAVSGKLWHACGAAFHAIRGWWAAAKAAPGGDKPRAWGAGSLPAAEPVAAVWRTRVRTRR